MTALQKQLGHRKKRKRGEERRAVAMSQARAPLVPPVCSKPSLSTDLHRSRPDSCLPLCHLQRSTGHSPFPPTKPLRGGERGEMDLQNVKWVGGAAHLTARETPGRRSDLSHSRWIPPPELHQRPTPFPLTFPRGTLQRLFKISSPRLLKVL